MSNKQTSRVFAVWDAVFDIINGLQLPGHPENNNTPTVFYGDMNEERTEAIIVVGVPADAPAPVFVTFGTQVSQEEEFTLRIIVGTKVTGCTAKVARDRLAEICEFLQQAFRNPDTGRPAGDISTIVPQVQWWRMGRVAPQIYAMPDGFGGYAELDLTVNARI